MRTLTLVVVLSLAFTFSLGVSSSGSIIEFKNKHLNVLFDDINYRFTLQREFTPTGEYLRELLFLNLPPTSFVTVRVDGVSYNLNECDVIIPPEITKDGKLRFKCKIREVTVSIVFSFIKNASSQEEDTLKIETTVSNCTNSPKVIDVRYLLDTFFGENKPKPKFYLDGKTPVDYELLLTQTNMISYVVSSSDISGVNNLYITWEPTPSRIIFSNWRKLSISTWDTEISPFLKYRFSETSSEDCAVAVFFEGVKLVPNEEKSFNVMLSTTQYLPVVENQKPTEEMSDIKTPPKQDTKSAEISVVTNIVTNIVFVTNEILQPKPQEITVKREVVTTNVITNFLTNFVTNLVVVHPPLQPTRTDNNGEIRRKILEIEEKVDKLSQSIEKMFSQLTNIQVQEAAKKDREVERDIAELRKIKLTLVKLTKTLDTLEERIAMINKYIEIRKRFADKRIVVYSPEEYKKDIELIEEISEALDSIMDEVLFGVELDTFSKTSR